jgi:hypothetical protein
MAGGLMSGKRRRSLARIFGAPQLKCVDKRGRSPHDARMEASCELHSDYQRVLVAPRSHARNSRMEPNWEAPTAASAGA